MKRINSLCLV
uniref:Uncharacterized protein n=1 Tax=Anguilla anguilla TaxID=7936 RepID=A0A0E9QN27_ANGAN